MTLDAVDPDYVYLTVEFSQPGRFEFPFGRQATLADALYSDGSFSSGTQIPARFICCIARGLTLQWSRHCTSTHVILAALFWRRG
jgi:hypothetical protein